MVVSFSCTLLSTVKTLARSGVGTVYGNANRFNRMVGDEN